MFNKFIAFAWDESSSSMLFCSSRQLSAAGKAFRKPNTAERKYINIADNTCSYCDQKKFYLPNIENTIRAAHKYPLVLSSIKVAWRIFSILTKLVFFACNFFTSFCQGSFASSYLTKWRGNRICHVRNILPFDCYGVAHLIVRETNPI